MTKIGQKENNNKVEDVLAFIFIKQLITPVMKSKAYKLGLVDTLGKTIKEPKTLDEKEALTPFKKLVFKIKRLLGNKIMQLNNFLYVSSIPNDMTDKIRVLGGVEKRAEIKRMKKELEQLSEKYGYEINDLIEIVLHEELKESTKNTGYLKE